MQPTTDAFKLMMEGSRALAQMEMNGVQIHMPRLRRAIAKTEHHIKCMEEELKADPIYAMWKKEFGYDAKLSSDPQLAHILYTKLGIQCVSWTTGGVSGKKKPSVSEKALQDVDHPFVKKIFEVRHLKKTVSTFLKGILRETVDGIVHPFYNLHTTVTWRSSSDSPNWQNLPKRDPVLSELVRRCIISRKGRKLWEIDFKFAEVVVAACVTRDPVLLDYVRDKTKDMHRDSAMGLYLLEESQVSKPIRNSAKQWFVFAEFYGDYYIHCAKNLWEAVDREGLKLADGTPLRKHLASKGIKELGDLDPKLPPRPKTYEVLVKDFENDFWNKRFQGYTAWKKKWWEDYQANGYFITPTGFLIQWGKNGPMSRNDALNNPIQGASFHCDLWTIIRLQKWLNRNKMKTLIVGQIHDSAVLDSPPEEVEPVMIEAKRIIKEDLPQHYKWLIAPMTVEISAAPVGGSWFDMKDCLLP